MLRGVKAENGGGGCDGGHCESGRIKWRGLDPDEAISGFTKGDDSGAKLSESGAKVEADEEKEVAGFAENAVAAAADDDVEVDEGGGE